PTTTPAKTPTTTAGGGPGRRSVWEALRWKPPSTPAAVSIAATPSTGEGRGYQRRSHFDASSPPPWVAVGGTPFIVDGFRYARGAANYCQSWFLSHFHADHYQGLSKGFSSGVVYCSSITARLVRLKFKVPEHRIRVLRVMTPYMIEGVKVTCLDANHCPGAVMFLFEPPRTAAILHTGDFRYNPSMQLYAPLQVRLCGAYVAPSYAALRSYARVCRLTGHSLAVEFVG
ncbi:hypothetical protein CYMTET_30199, partial [Cymbomonas tetramitiformis]